MPLTHAEKVITDLKVGTVPAPSREDIRRAYDDIYKRAGKHSEPLRTHIYGDNALGVGARLGALLCRYLLETELPRSSTSSSSKIRRF